MEKIEILIICRHTEILQTITRLVNNNQNWQGIPAQTDEEAMAIFDTNTIKLVLLGSGIEQQSEINLFTYFKTKNPEIIIVQHYGGGSGLLAAEIYEALK